MSEILIPIALNESLRLEEYFDLNQPLEVDIGCGKGSFLIARARAHPSINYLGIDRKLSRIRKVCRKIGAQGLRNVRILHAEAAYAVGHLLPPGSVSTFYALFPDPWPKRRHHRRRLFCEAFVSAIYSRLVPGGVIHIATDHAEYFEIIAHLFKNDPRFEQCAPLVTSPEEWSDFERTFLTRQIVIERLAFRKRTDQTPNASEQTA
ncbi:MAG: tRNA (guanosine(46)-N7)-methyltransferase TrmB [Kiritimatiellae bacterium]|nr:tRNA (guanosine(46)-N7)-methyltransferase TrmB [Kiritimatiellia bacterium]